MLPNNKVIKVYIRGTNTTELKDGDPPQNLTISPRFRINDKFYNSSMIEFKWFSDNNEIISDRIKISDDVSFACSHSIISEDRNGSVQLSIYNIDKAFSRSIYLKAFYRNETSESEIEVENRKIDLSVTKKYITVPLRSDDPIRVVVGEIVKLNISEVLKKESGKPEISYCTEDVYKMDSHYKDVFYYSRTLPKNEIFFNESDNELVLKTYLPHSTVTFLKCELVIDNLHKIPFTTKLEVKNLIILAKRNPSYVECHMSLSLGFSEMKLTRSSKGDSSETTETVEEYSNEFAKILKLISKEDQIKDGSFYCVGVNKNKSEYVLDHIKIEQGVSEERHRLKPCYDNRKLECDDNKYPKFRAFKVHDCSKKIN